jgi:hypothetical protein
MILALKDEWMVADYGSNGGSLFFFEGLVENKKQLPHKKDI